MEYQLNNIGRYCKAVMLLFGDFKVGVNTNRLLSYSPVDSIFYKSSFSLLSFALFLDLYFSMSIIPNEEVGLYTELKILF